MDDEMRGAAERLAEFARIARQGTPNQAPAYRDAAYMAVYNGKPHSQLVDMATVAEAWLAEHPADAGEPVTPDWLAAVGFREVDLSWRKTGMGNESEPNAFTIGGAPDVGYDEFGVWAGDGKWAIYRISADGFDGSEDWLAWTPTRGDVRRLLVALGIPIQEPPHA